MHKHNCQKPILPERRVLLTRPKSKSDLLADQLAEHSIYSYCHPLLHVEIQHCCPQSHFYNADIIIAISENAVMFSDQQIKGWPKAATYFAVGHATQGAFKRLNINAIIPDDSTSEGLLALPCLTDVQHKNISIIRGVGGREKLATSLIERGANVSYFEVYKRQLVEIKANGCIRQWQQDRINTIVVTSGEMLMHIYANIGDNEQLWFKNLWLVVPSERIAEMAKSLGVLNISMSNGADNASILKILLSE